MHALATAAGAPSILPAWDKYRRTCPALVRYRRRAAVCQHILRRPYPRATCAGLPPEVDVDVAPPITAETFAIDAGRDLYLQL
jgi:hypothetical protein